MGIQGLLPLLKDIQVKKSISSYSGLTVGIDVYCWLHKGAYGCAKELILGKPTKLYVNYVMRRVDMLISNNVTPILVFDGGHLPAKAETEKVRRAKKKQHRARGMAALKEGNSKEAFENFQRCIDITPEMAGEVIQECFSMNVQCIVAPYEADAQLAYLMKEGITQLTISEDSDLLLYGCDKVMYKMSIDGEGFVIDLANLSNVQTIQLASFTTEKFRHMCMLSGCDYLSSIKGMGLIKAFKSLRRFSTVFQCIKSLKCDPSYNVPKDYEENFRKADLVFKYQLVFDIRTKHLIRLNEINDLDEFGDAEKDFAGPNMDDSKGLQIALGNIDPISGKILAQRGNFASGDITQKLQKSTSWNSPTANIPPPKPNQNTAFQFNRNSQQSSPDLTLTNSQTSNKPAGNFVVNKSPVIASSPKVEANKSPAIASSPQVEANKSLKRLRDEVSVTTREEKIRKLYKEEKVEGMDVPEVIDGSNSDKDLLLGSVVHKRHHNVFAKKTRKLRNPFKQVNHEQSDRVVVSRFFENKIVHAKENTILQVDTPSPEKPMSNVTSESTKTPQIEGSFLDYLDKTNVRGYEVKALTLDSPIETSKQKKLDKICSPKKTKRMNKFSISKNETNQSPVICSPIIPSNDDKIDFNITIPLDEVSVRKKPSLKLGLSKSNTKNRANIFSHFEHKSKVNICQEHLKRDEVVNRIINDETNNGKYEVCNDGVINIEDSLQSHVEKYNMDVEIVELDSSKFNTVCENKTIQSVIKGSSRSLTNVFSNFERKTKYQASEHSNSNEVDTIKSHKNRNCRKSEDSDVDEVVDLGNESVQLQLNNSDHQTELENSCKETKEKVCVDEETSIVIDDQSALPQIEVGMYTDLLGESQEKVIINIDKTMDVKNDQRLHTQLEERIDEDLLFYSGKNGGTNISETTELNEEPLPFHLKHSIKVDTGKADKLDEEKVDESMDVIYLDEEPLPFHLDKNTAMDLVKNSALPTKISSKRCKPIGLSRKRKSLEKTVSDNKLKQMTFDRFAFKKKSIERSDTADIICLS